MQIVIDIPKSVIEHLKDGSFGARIEDRATLIDAVMSGTPLPEHHGRLMILSEDKVKENQIELDFSCQKWISEVGLSYATIAIIEADRGE